jgi:urea transport system substrate-binding protein
VVALATAAFFTLGRGSFDHNIGKLQPDGQFEVVWTAAKPEPPVPYPTSRTTEEWRAFLHDLYTGWGNEWSAPEK